MKSVALTPVLLVCFLAACGKPETAASASQPEGKPDAPVAGHAPKPKAARNVPLEQYVEVSNGIYSFTPEQGFEVIAFNAAISQVDPKLPPDFDLLARLSSKEYDRTQDAFKKRELLATLQPKLEERIAHFQASPYVATVHPQPGASQQCRSPVHRCCSQWWPPPSVSLLQSGPHPWTTHRSR